MGTIEPTPDELGALAAELSSGDELRIRAALAKLRSSFEGSWTKHGNLVRLEDAIASLARHSSANIRTSVARLAVHLGDTAYNKAMAALLGDEDVYVNRAAQRSRRLRVALPKDVLSEHDDAFWARALEEISGPDAKSAREVARRAGESFAERLIQQQHHEIKNGIVALGYVLESAERILSDERGDRAKAREEVKLARQRLALTQGILDSFKRLWTPVKPEFRRERLQEVVGEAASIVVQGVRASAPPLAVENLVDPDLTTSVHRVQLIEALVNVIRNAWEAYEGDQPRRVRITSSLDDGDRTVTVTIEDFGRGMNPDLFATPFHRRRTTKADGLGFGLVITTKIIEREHRGRLSFESRPGHGTKVHVQLPLRRGRKRS